MVKPYEIEKLLKKHGDITLSELFEKSKGRNKYLCPKCDGKGHTTKMIDMYPKGLPDSGWAVDMHPLHIDCDLCLGIGYTYKEYKPIIKTQILGYE